MADKLLALEFKIALMEIEPPIWRRVLVPAKARMWDLHVAIQDAMGWWDCHLHQFVIGDSDRGRRRGRRRAPPQRVIGMPDSDGMDCLVA